MIFQSLTLLFLVNLFLLFPLMNHPLSMGLNLLVSTVVLSTFLSTSMSHPWLSYCLVLILLGGLLVIFIYVALLAPNEVFSKKKILWPLTLFNLLFVTPSLFLFNKEMVNCTLSTSADIFMDSLEWLTPFYSQEMGTVTIFLVFYLLMTLLVVVYITKSHSTALRSYK